MSLKTFRIEFDQPGAIYVPGDFVTGNVIIELDRTKKIRAVKLSLKGEANVRWETTETRNGSSNKSDTTVFKANEIYFKTTLYLLGGIEDHAELQLAAGFRKYPFSFQLPYNIPCSFEHTYGHIRYTIKAIIDRPWKFDHQSKTAFTVITPYDLNLHSHECIGIDDGAIKKFGCFNSGAIKIRITSPTTGFVPGQPIETTIHFDNMSNSVNVMKICSKLERLLEFNSSSPYHSVKKDNTFIKKEQCLNLFGKEANMVSKLLVPSIPPSQLEFCNIIHQRYRLRITLHMSGVHSKIVKSYPIVIGTIPLRSMIPSISLVSPYPQTIPQPTAPMMKNDEDLPEKMPMETPIPMPMSTDNALSIPYPNSRLTGANNLSNQPGPSTNQWDMPPPSYEECIHRTNNIKDHEDSHYVYGINESFAPRYPVFNFSSP